MGRGKAISEADVAVILALKKDTSLSVRAIAERVKRSKSVVASILARQNEPCRRRRMGRPPKVTPQFRRVIIRAATKGFTTARAVAAQHQSPVGLRRVQQLLQDATHLQWSKLCSAPRLTPEHKLNRKKWATEQLAFSPNLWRRTVFSDEKRFCLDGPDGSAHYWADTRVDKRFFSKRQQGGGGVMVWGCFSWRGKPDLAFISGKMNASGYVDVLDKILLPWVEQTFYGEWRFQQDNAPVHTAAVTKDFFMTQDMRVIDWPARSPDLNPIENLWGLLVQEVYAGFRSFDYEDDLVEAINFAWEKISLEYLRTLIKSMPKRCVEVIEKRGGPTHY